MTARGDTVPSASLDARWANAERRVCIAGRELVLSAVFDTYWKFACLRQDAYRSRVEGSTELWNRDPIIAAHRFTNAYRAADRTSQYLIRHVIYEGAGSYMPEDVVFRVLLFKFFNRIETWRSLVDAVGQPTWRSYDFETYAAVLGGIRDRGETVYSAAYMIPPPHLGESGKHRNHLRLLELMMSEGLPDKLVQAPSMESAFKVLRDFPSVGDFLAYQFLIDLNYSPLLHFSEMEFVVPGPGARDGIRKCFGRASDGIEAPIIEWMTAHQQENFERLGLEFDDLWGRALQLIDIQNLFCEVDKYSRVAHPDVQGISGRSRIKQMYRRDSTPLVTFFPPKWGINDLLPRLAVQPVSEPVQVYEQLALV